MAAVTLGKRVSPTEDPLSAKKPQSNPIDVTVLKTGDVQFDYEGRITQLSLVKLKEVSSYFASFFSGNWQQKSEDGTKYKLLKPDDVNFSPSLFMDFLHAYVDLQTVLEIDSMEAALNAVNLIHFYGFKGQFRIKNSDFLKMTYGDVKKIMHLYEVLAQIIDRKKLALHCCQAILNEPGFVNHCLFASEAHKFLSLETQTLLRLFDKIRIDIVSLEVEIHDTEKTIHPMTGPLQEAKKDESKVVGKMTPDRTLCLTTQAASLERALSLFPNLQELRFVSTDADWRELVTGDYFMENFYMNEFHRMLVAKFSGEFKHLRTITIPFKDIPSTVVKFMNNKTYILEFRSDGKICIYRRRPNEKTTVYHLDFMIGYPDDILNGYPQVDESLIRGLLSFPPTPEVLEGIDPSRLPWTEEGKLRPGLGVHDPVDKLMSDSD